MKIFPLTIYVLLKPFIQILPSDSKKSLWDSRTTATLGGAHMHVTQAAMSFKEMLMANSMPEGSLFSYAYKSLTHF
jgi:hypothetical protein